MANFGGHAIPGSFFLLFGLWLMVKHILTHIWSKRPAPRGRQDTPPFLKTMNYVEGGFQMFAAFVGIMVEQFVVDGPHARLYSSENQSWVKLMNWQHSTMYLFFGIHGLVLVFTTRSKAVPACVDRVTLSLALFVEGFLFYYHLHNRPPLDAHVHTVLLVPVFAGSVSSMLEFFIRGNVVLQVFTAAMFLLQGSWFYQIGFVLYPPSGKLWDLEQHANIMFVTMCFCWHMAAVLLSVCGASSLVCFCVNRFSGRCHEVEIGLRSTSSSSSSSCQKALLEESEEE